MIGAPPQKSPSLNLYPRCDEEVKQIAAELWADCDGVKIKERRFGQGRVVRGVEPEKVLADAGLPPDFSSGQALRYIHRAMENGDVYFVANPAKHELATEGEATAAAIRAAGGEALYVQTDVTHAADCARLAAAAVERYGRLEVVICCAGILQGAMLQAEALDEATFERVLTVNTKGPDSLFRGQPGA